MDGLRSSISTAWNIYRNKGAASVAATAARKGHRAIGKRANYGISPYDRNEWDVLIILDACRYDLFTEFAPQHPVFDRFESVEAVYSHASTSREWLQKTFVGGPPHKVADTYYIAANGFTSDFNLNNLYGLEEVWRYGIDSENHIVPPGPVTNAAIARYRTSDAPKYIIHYTPPHAPFLHCAGKYDSTNDEQGATQNVWSGLREGKYDFSEVWADYGQHLIDVLDHVETIIENVEGTVAVSADHGNGVGEFGIYGHPGYCLVPAVKRVPWAIATGDGNETFDVDFDAIGTDTERTDNDEINEHLRNLGYLV